MVKEDLVEIYNGIDFPGGSDGKESAFNAGDLCLIPRPLERGMATNSNILAWRIPRTEEPGGP